MDQRRKHKKKQAAFKPQLKQTKKNYGAKLKKCLEQKLYLDIILTNNSRAI